MAGMIPTSKFGSLVLRNGGKKGKALFGRTEWHFCFTHRKFQNDPAVQIFHFRYLLQYVSSVESMEMDPGNPIAKFTL
jgi:hypothetical protein